MNIENIYSKEELEKEFANDFASPVFPILSEFYLKNKDFRRAEKVCQIGLKHDPDNINGYYILAKVYLCNHNLEDAEKLLIILLKKNPLHINALRLIIELQEQLKKKKKEKIKYLKQLFSLFPDDGVIKEKILNLDKESLEKAPKKSKEKINVTPSIDFNINHNMATLTFVEILKQQKHYLEALYVLSIIEEKSSATKQTKQIKTELKELVSKSY